MDLTNPNTCQFLLGWIKMLDSVPENDMLMFLPDFIDGLLDMLSDSSQEIQQLAESILSEFLQKIKFSSNVDSTRLAEKFLQRAGSPDEHIRRTSIKWICELLRIDGRQLVPSYADILRAILHCISDTKDDIKKVARETNKLLRAMLIYPAERVDIGVMLVTAMSELESPQASTRLEAINWVAFLMVWHRNVLSVYEHDVTKSVWKFLFDPSHEVFLLAIDVHACSSQKASLFLNVLGILLNRFRDSKFLVDHGFYIVRRLCMLVDSERVYREFSKILEEERDLDFASKIVQALNFVLLSSSECAKLRELLKQSLVNIVGKDLFICLYSSWCHSPVSTISLCLLSQAYQLASAIIHTLREEDIDVQFLAQMNTLIHILETSSLASLRLQLLEPGKCIWLMKSLYGLLMLLPQENPAFKILWARLRTVPSFPFRSEKGKDILPIFDEDDFTSMLQKFEQLLNQHHVRAKRQDTRLSTSLTLSQEPKGEDSHQRFPVPTASSSSISLEQFLQQLLSSPTQSQRKQRPGLPPRPPRKSLVAAPSRMSPGGSSQQ